MRITIAAVVQYKQVDILSTSAYIVVSDGRDSAPVNFGIADFQEPAQYSKEMDYVFVNDVKAIDNGKKTGKLAGRIIKKQ